MHKKLLYNLAAENNVHVLSYNFWGVRSPGEISWMILVQSQAFKLIAKDILSQRFGGSGGSAFKLTHVGVARKPQFLSDCGLEASVPHPLGLTT